MTNTFSATARRALAHLANGGAFLHDHDYCGRASYAYKLMDGSRVIYGYGGEEFAELSRLLIVVRSTPEFTIYRLGGV